MYKSIKKNEKKNTVGNANWDSQLWELSVKSYQQYLELIADPYNIDQVQSRICEGHIKLKEPDEAIKYCTIIIKRSEALGLESSGEDELNAFVNRAEAYLLKGNYHFVSQTFNFIAKKNR